VIFRMLIVWCVVMCACQKPCAQDCGGCCDETGTCFPGTSASACGQRGTACQVCAGSLMCGASGCERKIGIDAGSPDAGLPTSCFCTTGCCLPNGACAPGNLSDVCGVAKMFCAACAAGTRCELGVCMSARCAGCLDVTSLCRMGDSNDFCGTDAGICLSCSVSQMCLQSVCR
jgi:hypothetical protein